MITYVFVDWETNDEVELKLKKPVRINTALKSCRHSLLLRNRNLVPSRVIDENTGEVLWDFSGHKSKEYKP